MDFVPLADVWPQNGLLSITLAALEDAGFHPIIECNPRGWIYFYSWPLGSSQSVRVWIPRDEEADALAFLQAPTVLPWEPSDDEPGSFWAGLSHGRRLVYAGWLLGSGTVAPLLIALAGLYAWADCPDVIEGQPF